MEHSQCGSLASGVSTSHVSRRDIFFLNCSTMDAQGNVEQYDPLASSCVAETVGYITLGETVSIVTLASNASICVAASHL